jgi:hypothetical protein
MLSEKTWIYVDIQVCEENPNYRYNFPVNCGRVPSFFSQGIVEGDNAYSIRGSLVGELIRVDQYAIKSKNSIEHFQDIEKAVSISVLAKLLVTDKDNTITYQDQEIKVGAPLEISTKKMNIFGIVKDIEGEAKDIQPMFIEKLITVKMLRHPPELIQSFKSGVIDTDESGKITSEIIDVKIAPHQTSVPNDDGELILAIDPYYKDIMITLRVFALQGKRSSYFQDHAMIVGGRVDLLVGDEYISGILVGVEDEK